MNLTVNACVYNIVIITKPASIRAHCILGEQVRIIRLQHWRKWTKRGKWVEEYWRCWHRIEGIARMHPIRECVPRRSHRRRRRTVYHHSLSYLHKYFILVDKGVHAPSVRKLILSTSSYRFVTNTVRANASESRAQLVELNIYLWLRKLRKSKV